MTDKKEVKDKNVSPSIFAGMKFYEVLMDKQKNISMLSHSGNLYHWRIALFDYYSATRSFISPSVAAKLDKAFTDAEVKINNFELMKDKLGKMYNGVYNLRHNELFKLQMDLLAATDKLNLKTSEGESDFFDVRKFFST